MATSREFVAAKTRPATSHITDYGWQYNAAQETEKPNHIPGFWALCPPPSTDEAQLLLGLSMGRSHTVAVNGLGHELTNRGGIERVPSTQYTLVQAGLVRDSSDVFRDTLNDFIRQSEGTECLRPIETHSPLRVGIAVQDNSADVVPLSDVVVNARSSLQTNHPETNQVTGGEQLKRPKPVRQRKGKTRQRQLNSASTLNTDKRFTPEHGDTSAPSGQGQESLKILQPSETHPDNTAGFDLPVSKQADLVGGRLMNVPSTLSRKRRVSDFDGTQSSQIKDSIRKSRASSLPASYRVTSEARKDQTLTQAAVAVSRLSKIGADTTCSGCGFSRNSVNGERESWISCNGCKSWFHFACAGFKNEREVRNVDKYYCRQCKAKHGATTFVRKSARAHTSVDYARLQEGVVTTSSENPEHHYIQSFKENKFKFQPENFPRMRPELVTADYFERSTMTVPVVIPAAWNPRPSLASEHGNAFDASVMEAEGKDLNDTHKGDDEWLTREFSYDLVADEGQDKLDMVIPQGLTVRHVAELYGPEARVEVIDVKLQEGEDKRWNMKKWADYYEEEGAKVVRNVISLEVSQSKLGRLIRRPQVVRQLDLQDSVWPAEDIAKGNVPRVQFYCLMSVADCYTDFHIDFGGSSVYYHILKGKKTFFFIPPTAKHLKKYEDWCLSPAQNHTFLPDQTKECYRVDLSEGDTMLIPSGWIHAVWTPENSLVIGGNFLTRQHYAMQIRIAEIEKATKVPRKFRYPHFQKVLWYAVVRYIERDPLPPAVKQLFVEGQVFHRETPIYYHFEPESNNSQPGEGHCNARYYSQAELDGLPDLQRYVFKTLLISLGKVESIPNEVRNAVTRSIPKGHGEPLDICKTFAMWTAWKRGNEEIPLWAHPDAELPDTSSTNGEKKLSAASLKKLERRSATGNSQVLDRRSTRRQSRAQIIGANGGASAPEGSAPAARAVETVDQLLDMPKSELSPRRMACDCGKRRIRCEHKDNAHLPRPSNRKDSATVGPVYIRDLNSGTTQLSNLEGLVNNGIVDVPRVPFQSSTSVAVVINQLAATSYLSESLPFSGMAPSLSQGRQFFRNTEGEALSATARSRACAHCRKSKRRCVHNESGEIDLIKAAEPPMSRSLNSAKKRKGGPDVSTPRATKAPKVKSLSTGFVPEVPTLHNISIPVAQDPSTEQVIGGPRQEIPDRNLHNVTNQETPDQGTECYSQTAGLLNEPHSDHLYGPNLIESQRHVAGNYSNYDHHIYTADKGESLPKGDHLSRYPFDGNHMRFEHSLYGNGNHILNASPSEMPSYSTIKNVQISSAEFAMEDNTVFLQQEPTPPDERTLLRDVEDDVPGARVLRLPTDVALSQSSPDAGVGVMASPALTVPDHMILDDGDIKGAEQPSNGGTLIATGSRQNHATITDEFDGLRSIAVRPIESGLNEDSDANALGEDEPHITARTNEVFGNKAVNEVADQDLAAGCVDNVEPICIQKSPGTDVAELQGVSRIVGSAKITPRTEDCEALQSSPPASLAGSSVEREHSTSRDDRTDLTLDSVMDNTVVSTKELGQASSALTTTNVQFEDDDDEELSPPISPLTQASPTPPALDVRNASTVTTEQLKSRRHSTRQSKQVERYAAHVYEGSYELRNHSLQSVANQTPARGTRFPSVTPRTKRKVLQAPANNGKRETSIHRDESRHTASSAAMNPVEEESLRLAKQFQGHEFGLRRRSSRHVG